MCCQYIFHLWVLVHPLGVEIRTLCSSHSGHKGGWVIQSPLFTFTNENTQLYMHSDTVWWWIIKGAHPQKTPVTFSLSNYLHIFLVLETLKQWFKYWLSKDSICLGNSMYNRNLIYWGLVAALHISKLEIFTEVACSQEEGVFTCISCIPVTLFIEDRNAILNMIISE